MPDLPDWVGAVEPAIDVIQVAAGDTGKYSGTDQTYQEVASWTVTTHKVGELKEILIISDDYEHTLAKITIGTVTWANDWNPLSSMPIIFEDLKLAEGIEAKVEVKSDDGTAIEVDAIIVGKETG